MRKMLVIAAREYHAAVRTKAFLIGLLLMPVMMLGSVGVQFLFKDMVDTADLDFVLVDRTPGEEFAPKVKAAAEKYKEEEAVKDGKQVKPFFQVHEEPAAADADLQRFELSERVRHGKLAGFVEILPRAPGSADSPAPLVVRYQSNRLTHDAFAHLVEKAVSDDRREELARAAKLSKAQENDLLKPAVLQTKGLSTRNPVTDQIEEAPDQSRVASFLVPAGMMVLMFMVVLMAATPLMQGVVEEKMQRIAEVLLGSVRPFELMAGKLVGMAAVSLTIGAVYLGGAYWAAAHYGFADLIGYDLLAWFLAFQALAALMYGSLFIAVGAACTDMKETQTLLWPVMLLAMLPMFILGNVMQEPNGPLATGLSFFPFSTPMLMIVRQAVPPGLPWWQPVLGMALVLATTTLCVYVAGRIFRVGLLMQGKGARVGDLVRWVIRG
jgi:ABC-type Na+ efflux pump permease subunit